MAGSIKVMVVDDHELVRTGIARILNHVPGIEVVAEAATIEEVAHSVIEAIPEVLVLDLDFSGDDNEAGIRKLATTAPELKVIVISSTLEASFQKRLLQAGVSGFLSKYCPMDQIILAIRTVQQGELYLGYTASKKALMPGKSNGDKSPFQTLVPREMQVMLMLAQGLGVQAISKSLRLNLDSVGLYRQQLHEKLGVSSDADLMRLAKNHGLLKANDRP